MTARYVPVPAAAIRERLAAAGFQLVPAAHGEEVYERRHDRDPRYVIKVYSSIQRGAEDVRDCGTDANQAWMRQLDAADHGAEHTKTANFFWRLAGRLHTFDGKQLGALMPVVVRSLEDAR